MYEGKKQLLYYGFHAKFVLRSRTYYKWHGRYNTISSTWWPCQNIDKCTCTQNIISTVRKVDKLGTNKMALQNYATEESLSYHCRWWYKSSQTLKLALLQCCNNYPKASLNERSTMRTILMKRPLATVATQILCLHTFFFIGVGLSWSFGHIRTWPDISLSEAIQNMQGVWHNKSLSDLNKCLSDTFRKLLLMIDNYPKRKSRAGL